MNDSNCVQNRNVYFYRPTKMTGMDGGEYYIGFAKRCTCGKPQKGSMCICKPKSVKSNGIETGDIFFDKKSYSDESIQGAPPFGYLAQLFAQYPMILGYETDDTGRNSDKKRLIWKIPRIRVKAYQLPTIDMKKDSSSDSAPSPVPVPNPVISVPPSTMRKNISRAITSLEAPSIISQNRIDSTKMSVFAPVFKPKNNVLQPCASVSANSQSQAQSQREDQVFSWGSGLVIPKKWSFLTIKEWMALRDVPEESKLHVWKSTKWDYTIPCLAGLNPPLYEMLMLNE
jgi:hypothetical protein